MAKFKLIISDPMTGKSSASEIEGTRAQALVGRTLGETIDGSALGIGQGKFLISGGCDKNGIPMREDVHGGAKKYIVLSAGPGFNPTRHGERRRKLVRGKTITDETYQINFTAKKATGEEEKPRAEPKAMVATQPPSEVQRPAKEKPTSKTRTKKTAKKSGKKTKK
jgi:small subunit ribosomal protein S6e